jgi:hypothetical protein
MLSIRRPVKTWPHTRSSCAGARGPETHTNIRNIFRKRGSTFYRRSPAAGPPPTTDFRYGFCRFYRRSGIRGIFLYVPFLYVFFWCLRCTTNEKAKTAAIADAQARIEELSTFIEEATHGEK